MAFPMRNRKRGKTRFLPDGQTIRREVKRLFTNEKGRRVALVAFVGKSADAYLPRPKGLELVCWPQAPGTNPDIIDVLINKKKVNVRFADRLHMKLYWTESQGAVVASANLSTNAYGKGALHEAGVLLPSKAVNIEVVLKTVDPKKVTRAALAKLRAGAKRQSGRSPELGRKRTFLHWLKQPKRIRWMLHCYDTYGGGPSKRLRDEAKEETGSTRVLNWIYCRKGEVQPEAFVLPVDLASKRRPLADDWLFAHRVVLVAKKDKQYSSEWPYQAGQLHRNAACPPSPFFVDSHFRAALRAAYKELGSGADAEFSIETTRRPSNRLLKLLEKCYRRTAK